MSCTVHSLIHMKRNEFEKNYCKVNFMWKCEKCETLNQNTNICTVCGEEKTTPAQVEKKEVLSEVSSNNLISAGKEKTNKRFTVNKVTVLWIIILLMAITIFVLIGVVSQKDKTNVHPKSGQADMSMMVDDVDVNEKETATSEKTQSESNSKSSVSVQTTDKSIMFRNVPWYSTKKEVDELLTDEDLKTNQRSMNDAFRLSGINNAHTTMPDDRVEGGGYIVWYPDAEVAGYKTDGLEICYMYPMENGNIVLDDNRAEMYFAYYTLSIDYVEYDEVYRDLSEKLTSLYGDGVSKNEYGLQYTMWSDSEGNIIRINLGTQNNYVTLGYMANGAEKRLDELQNVLDERALEEEKENREANKSNTSGL